MSDLTPADLSPEAQGLFKGARKDLGPNDRDVTRMERRLAVQLGVATAIGSATSAASAGIGGATAATSGASTVLLVASKWIAAVAIAGGIGAGAAVYSANDDQAPVTTTPRPNSLSASRPEFGVPPSPNSLSASRPEFGVPPTPAPTLIPTPPAAPPLLRGTVADETRILRDAHLALQNGDAARALALLGDHARAFPNGVLAEERAVERVFALCKLGLVPEARAEAVRFLAANPESPLAKSVGASCGAPPNQ